MIKAVIFDFFDVLRTDGFRHWLNLHNLKLSDAVLAATERHDRGETNDPEFFTELGRITGQTAEEVYHECEASNILNVELVHYTETLRARGFRTALLSNSNATYLRGELAYYDLEQYFDVIAISGEIGLIKPERAIFEYILSALNLSAVDCVFTDDNPRHIAGAEKVGIRSILFVNNQDFIDQLEQIIK